jgi:glycogen debranching enzyme
VTAPIVHPLIVLHGDGVGLACGDDGTLAAHELHGLFAGDTRVLSTWRFTIGGHPWRLLARSRVGASTAQWDFDSPPIRAPAGELLRGALHARLRRRVLGTMHDDLTVTSFHGRPMPVRLALHLDADFADIFEVRRRSIPPRLDVSRAGTADHVVLRYRRGRFSRGVELRVAASHGAPSPVGAQLVFDVVLERGTPWTCCLDVFPIIDEVRTRPRADPHAAEPPPRTSALAIEAAPRLAAPFRRGCIDLDRLAVRDHDGHTYLAAGAPWFLALFGRDTLVTGLMAGLLGSWHVRGALAALGATQARTRDDYRDAEPGKILHELRHGELATTGRVPHTPYYGSHDAPALFVLALWNAWRWTGDAALLDAHLPAALAALRWCEEHGDLDGDGLLEYRTRSRQGYRNQGWKDAGDAIVDADGGEAALPIASVELQGYWYAARLAMAELLDARGQSAAAAAHRRAAAELRARVEERFWIEEAGCYALALDGKKRALASIASNPGHLLWCGLPSRERARRVAERLHADDVFSGYGVRTLSAAHPAYNPLSYQRGSVWPHDNALLAAGLVRYGLHAEAERVIEGILDAAASFEDHRLPELFSGLPRGRGAPVPYLEANVPQAWAAAAPILFAQLLLGLVVDAPGRRIHVAPWLPAWLPRIELRDVEIAGESLEIAIARSGEGARIERAHHPRLTIVEGAIAAPLWGNPEDPAAP